MSYSRIETAAPQRTLPGHHPRFESFSQPNSGDRFRSSMSSTSTTQRRSAIPTFRRQNAEPTPIRPREANSASLRPDLTTFRDMNGAGVSGGLFVNTSSPVNVQYIGTEFVPSVRPLDDHVVAAAAGINGDVHPTNASDSGSNVTIIPEPSQTAPYDIYYRHLLGEGRGVPLWEPGPDMGLPVDYRQKGIGIGDVGIVYRAGYFDFLFNIFLPADHEINLGRVPSGFVPLDKSKLEKSIRKSVVYDERGGCLASSSVQRTESSEFAFQTTGRDGAVLVMPDGALAEDLNKYKLVNQYIAENAKKWYDYVESEECGVQAENGDIRVVVGMDKVSSWGMVAFKSANAEEPPRRFKFKDDGRGGSHSKTYKWEGIVAGRAGPAEQEIRDLVRTDDVSGKVHNELAVHEIRASRLRECVPDASWHQTRSHGQSNINIQTPQVGLPVSNPSKPLHRYLLEKCPNAQVVITTDLDWMSVITENDVATPSFEEICSRVLASHTICEKKGVVTLKKRKNVVTGFVSDDRAVSTTSQTTSGRPLLEHNERERYLVGRVFLEAPDESAPSGTLSNVSVGKCRSDESESLLHSQPSCHDPSDDDGGGTNVSSAKQRILDSEDGPRFDSAAWKPGEDIQDLPVEYRDSPEDDQGRSLSPPYSDARPERSKDLSIILKDFQSKAVVTPSYAHRLAGTFCIAQGICTIAVVISIATFVVFAALLAGVRYRNPDLAFSFVPSSIAYLGKGDSIGSITQLSWRDSIRMICTGTEDSTGGIACLTRGESIGLILTAEAGLISLLYILFVLLFLARNIMRRHTSTSSRIFYQPVDIYMLTLFVCDALQAIGGLVTMTWVQDGKVDIESVLNAQGIIHQIGETAAIFSNMAIIIHIFGARAAILSRKFPVATIYTCISVLAPVVMVGNRHQDSSFMSPFIISTPYWCWIGERNVGFGCISAEYLWMWLSLATPLLLYIPLYLWMHRNPRFSRGPNPEIHAIRRRLLLYPMVYCICVLPLTTTRFLVQKEIFVPRALRFAAVTLFALSGFFKAAILLRNTSPSSGLYGTSNEPDHFCQRSPTTDSDDGPTSINPDVNSIAKTDGLTTPSEKLK